MLLVFDHDGSGTITQSEFFSRDGLCDTIKAQMNPHFNELDAPTDPIPSHSNPPPSYSNPPPSYSNPPPNVFNVLPNQPTFQFNPAPVAPAAPPAYQPAPLQIRCGRCQHFQSVTPPPGARVFIAVCGSCGAQNQVTL